MPISPQTLDTLEFPKILERLARHTSFSVERNGLEGALDLAIAKRVSCGAPQPDRDALLKALRKAKRAGPKS